MCGRRIHIAEAHKARQHRLGVQFLQSLFNRVCLNTDGSTVIGTLGILGTCQRSLLSNVTDSPLEVMLLGIVVIGVLNGVLNPIHPILVQNLDSIVIEHSTRNINRSLGVVTILVRSAGITDGLHLLPYVGYGIDGIRIRQHVQSIALNIRLGFLCEIICVYQFSGRLIGLTSLGLDRLLLGGLSRLLRLGRRISALILCRIHQLIIAQHDSGNLTTIGNAIRRQRSWGSASDDAVGRSPDKGVLSVGGYMSIVSELAQVAGNSGLAGACPVTARGGAVLGYAVFRMDDANFDAFFAPLLRGADDLLLVDATWRLLYASQPLRADDTLALLRAQLLSGKSLSDGDGERSYYVGACAESGFSLILQQPQTYTAQVVWSIYLVAALMGALCLVLCLVCAWWLSRRLFEPVNELDGAMRRVEGGDYDVRIESTRQDEMGRLAASFDRMTAEYRQNLERSVQRERELNETRLRMLQSQLNPHFLYNTLDCMKWLGVTGGVPQVAELAADLAALLRAGISGSEYITLEEELELIGRYLAIQEVRFGDRFVCELDVDERFQHCVVPKLILQPLVENAIIHGVADSDEGFIKLWAEEDAEGYLLLKVSDNGSGIPPEVLERLNSHELIPGGHLGLNNVDRIVRLSYGESCGLSAYPNEGGGSCVQLRLPMQKGEDHAQGTDR